MPKKHEYTLRRLKRLEGKALRKALLTVLRAEDVPLFNQYREATDYQRIDLRAANLRAADLRAADLRAADLRAANLRKANLSHVNLSSANLSEANLSDADLRDADLRDANLSHADLRGANLSAANLFNADLRDANLFYANLRHANLSSADLSFTNFHEAELAGADFAGARLAYTTFDDVDLSQARNLEQAEHRAPSTIGIDTLYLSEGKIPRAFLEGCGVPDNMITFAASLVGQAINYNSCFISYSHADETFARHLHMNLRAAGVRVWYAPEDMKMGGKIHEQIYEAIHLHDRLLLVLSEHSIKSNWVRTEIRRAYKRQLEEERQVLFPISLMSYDQLKAWESFFSDDGIDLAQEIREYFIGDFSNWKDHDTFQPLFERLLASLRDAAG